MLKKILAVVTLVVILSDGAFTQDKKPFKPHPFAPSIPELSKEEYAQINVVIDRFIDYDSGKLPDGDGKAILADFQGLGPEAIPPLIDGLNRAANLQASCPAVIIAKKLNKLILGSTDGQLLDLIRENVGAGVTIARHMNAIKDLKIACMTRKAYLSQTGQLAPPGKKAPKAMTTEDLAAAAGKEKGVYVKQILTELEQRQGEQVAIGLGVAMARPEADVKQLGQNLLLKHLSQQKAADLKALLKCPQDEVRLAVVFVIGTRKLPWGAELIDALDDAAPKVQQLARQALIQLSGGQDFGPANSASATARAQAVKAWRHWWKGQSSASSQDK